jgi:hypothetical protein
MPRIGERLLARYKSGQLSRQRLREAERKLPRYRELQAGIDEYFAAHRDDLMEWAQQAVTKIKQYEQPKRC